MSKLRIDKGLWLIIANIFLSFSGLIAQSSPYHIVNYKTKEGLPQNSVKNIRFDRAGYCWIGTEMGLVRFDGKNFKVFDTQNVNGLVSERIRFIANDIDDDIYILTDMMQKIRIEVSSIGKASHPVLIPPNTSNVWIPLRGGMAIQSSFLCHWSDSMLIKTQFLWGSNTGVATKDNEIYLVQQDKVLFVKDSRIITIDTFNTGIEDIKQMAVGDIFVMYYPNGRIKAWNRGAFVKNIRNINGPLKDNSEYKSGFFKSMIEDNETYIYAGSTLYRLLYHDGILDSEIVLDGIHIPAISTVYFNKENETFYIGSFISGLYVVSPSFFSYGKVPLENLENSFYAQGLLDDGSIFCQGYLFNDNGNFSKTPLSRFVGVALWISPDQQLYYGGDPVLRKFDFKNKRQISLANIDSRLSSIFPDRTDSSTLIFSTSCALYKVRNDVIIEKKYFPDKDKILTVMSMEQTGRDSFLLATKTGLKWYDYRNNKIYRSILKNKFIRASYAEGVDRVWCSTYGKGYFLYDHGRVTSLPTGTFPALKTIHTFIDDGRGFFWLSTNNGLYKVKKDDLLEYSRDTTVDVYFYSFNTFDNLKTNEFNGGCSPASLWLKDSMLSLPSLEGLVRFSPFEIKTVLPNKKIYITEIKIDEKVFDFAGITTLKLKPGFTKLNISISSPYFGNRENQRLRYKIEGLYSDWQLVPEDGEIKLNRIPAGTYKLIVRKLSGFGSTGIEPLQIKIQVAPRFYLTWWFMIIMAILLFYLIFLLIKFRIRLLNEKNLKLQKFIDFQTRDLSNTVDRLALSEKELKESNQMKDRVTTMVLHDLRSPIRFLHLMTNQLSKGFHKFSPEIMNQRLTALKTTTASLNQFTEQFFAWAASQHADFNTSTNKVNLDEVFNDIKDLYSDIVNVNGNILTFQITEIILFTDRNILSVILRNLVDNANNNTRNGAISLSGWQEAGTVIIAIKDNGTGFNEDELESFMDKTKGTVHGGQGSIIVSSLIEKIGGQLKIETQKDKGTVFKVQLSKYRADQSDSLF